MRTGLAAGAAEDDAGDAVEGVGVADSCVEAEIDVKVVGLGIKGDGLSEETEDEKELMNVLSVGAIVAVAVLDRKDVEDNGVLLLEEVDDVGLESLGSLDGKRELGDMVGMDGTDDCVAVSIECVMGLEF